jgi:gamma-glutamyl:cysteine ligase YbdK (ATP-grasp superfamily)
MVAAWRGLMGRDVPSINVSQQDRRRYREKVRQCLDALARMLRDSWFETETQQVGLEVELNLVDDLGAPSMRSHDVLAAIGDPHWAPELGRFNLEINVPPRLLAGDALDQLEGHLLASLKYADQRAQDVGSRLAMIGILPSLREADVTEDAMSANPRYWLLNEQICAARGEDARIAIEGPEYLLTHVDNIMPEAACTSVQCHVQVSPEDFPGYWNASQAVAGVQVALAANSPFLFGKELWRETRITLFQQATDTRPEELQVQGVRPRVWFGERWITSVFDLFEENIRYFPALLPLCADEDPVTELERGGTPGLEELTLHNGTVYRWNRPVYAVSNDRPHLRVENRVLPAGPTVADIAANAAFYYGLVRALAEAERPIWSQMSFAAAGENLLEAARHGIDAYLYWPGMGVVHATELTLRRLLPLASEGLRRWEVDSRLADRCLSIIEQRCLSGRTGATWQAETVHLLEHESRLDRHTALRRMTQQYIEHMHTNEPVHNWPPGC